MNLISIHLKILKPLWNMFSKNKENGKLLRIRESEKERPFQIQLEEWRKTVSVKLLRLTKKKFLVNIMRRSWQELREKTLNVKRLRKDFTTTKSAVTAKHVMLVLQNTALLDQSRAVTNPPLKWNSAKWKNQQSCLTKKFLLISLVCTTNQPKQIKKPDLTQKCKPVLLTKKVIRAKPVVKTFSVITCKLPKWKGKASTVEPLITLILIFSKIWIVKPIQKSRERELQIKELSGHKLKNRLMFVRWTG